MKGENAAHTLSGTYQMPIIAAETGGQLFTRVSNSIHLFPGVPGSITVEPQSEKIDLAYTVGLPHLVNHLSVGRDNATLASFGTVTGLMNVKFSYFA